MNIHLTKLKELIQRYSNILFMIHRIKWSFNKFVNIERVKESTEINQH